MKPPTDYNHLLLDLMKTLLLLLLVLLNFGQVACTQTPSQQQLEGEILHKPWSKSTQSYCAQGSDYFVIKTKEAEFVLENASSENLKDYDKQKVSLSGYFKEKVIKPRSDLEQRPIQQRPIEQMPQGSEEKAVEGFRCKVFVVEQVKAP